MTKRIFLPYKRLGGAVLIGAILLAGQPCSFVYLSVPKGVWVGEDVLQYRFILDSTGNIMARHFRTCNASLL